MSFREWAHAVLGPEAGDKLADDYANALGRTLDATVFHGTNPPKEPTMTETPEALTAPAIVVPEGFPGSEAEAIALAVAGAAQSIAEERDTWRMRAATLYGVLRYLVDQYPQTSFAGPGVAMEAALAALEEYAEPMGVKPEPTT